MFELGFTDAEPFCSYNTAETDFADGAKYRSQAKTHRKPIDLSAAFEVYRENEMLRETLRTGAFVFADGYFVLNDVQYVHYTENHRPELTVYAKAHLAECTLDFSTKLISTAMCHAQTPLLYRHDLKYKKKATLDANT